MRILYSHYLTDQNHPAVQMVENIADQLRQRGHEVLVHDSAGITTKNPGDKNESVPKRPSPLKLATKNSLWFGKEIYRNYGRIGRDRKVLREFQPDIVLTRQDAYCWSVIDAAREADMPCVTYADAPVAYECRMFQRAGRWHPPQIVERIERFGLQHSEAVITVSNPAAKRIRSYGLSTPVHVIPNGIELAKFEKPRAEQRDSVRKQLGIKSPVVLGFLGTFKEFHGIDRLRELMLSTSHRDDVTWLLIGDGPGRSELQKAVTNKTAAIFLGRKPAEEMGRWLSAIDIAVAPHAQMNGDFYFCPLKILEYAAAGCAVVASQQGDIPALLGGQGLCGVIVKDQQLSNWSSAIEGLIGQPERCRQLGESASHFVRQNLTWQHTARAVESVLLEALNIPTNPLEELHVDCPADAQLPTVTQRTVEKVT